MGIWVWHPVLKKKGGVVQGVAGEMSIQKTHFYSPKYRVTNCKKEKTNHEILLVGTGVTF